MEIEKFENVCEHPEKAKYIRVIHVSINCETIVIACSHCGSDLTEPEINC